MAVTSRYSRGPLVGINQFGSSQAVVKIRAAIQAGTLSVNTITLTGAQRLDTIAGKEYGDGRYWWIIAAASNIGWGLQVPPGTQISIPDLDSVLSLVA